MAARLIVQKFTAALLPVALLACNSPSLNIPDMTPVISITGSLAPEHGGSLSGANVCVTRVGGIPQCVMTVNGDFLLRNVPSAPTLLLSIDKSGYASVGCLLTGERNAYLDFVVIATTVARESRAKAFGAVSNPETGTVNVVAYNLRTQMGVKSVTIDIRPPSGVGPRYQNGIGQWLPGSTFDLGNGAFVNVPRGALEVVATHPALTCKPLPAFAAASPQTARVEVQAGVESFVLFDCE